MAESETYRLGVQTRIFLSFFFTVAPIGGIVGLIANLRGGEVAGFQRFVSVWLAVVMGQGVWMLWRMPWRIEVNEVTSRFVARSRQVEVPWSSLRSVKSPWFDLNRQSFLWTWDGGKLRTMGPWERQHHLLTTVEERAPQVRVEV